MSIINAQELNQIYKQKLDGMDLKKAEELKSSLNNNSDEKIKSVAQQFESMLVKMMLTQMTSSLESGGFFGGEIGADFYNDMYIDNMAKTISEKQSLGISDMIVRQLSINNTNLPDAGKQLQMPKAVSPIQTEKLQNEEIKQSEPVRTEEVPQIVSQPKTLMDRLTRYDKIIDKAADKYDLDKKLIQAVIAQESYGNPKATSQVGAKGLMQLMDGTARDLGVNNPYNPEENIMGGAKYLKQMKDKFGSDELALAAYNAGPGNVEKHNGIPPFKETKDYVRNVIRYKKSL